MGFNNFLQVQGLNTPHSSWGGSRFHKYTASDKVGIAAVLWNHCKLHPLSRLGEYRRACCTAGYSVSLATVSRTFKSWHWSFKKPHRSMYSYVFYFLSLSNFVGICNIYYIQYRAV